MMCLAVSQRWCPRVCRCTVALNTRDCSRCMPSDYHISELYFVWGNPWIPLLHTFNADDLTLVSSFQLYVRVASAVHC
jgi:hypothetical protein